MPISFWLVIVGAVIFIGAALYFIDMGKDKEKLSNMNDILKEIDRQKKQKERRDAKIKSMSDDELNSKLRGE